MADSDAESKSSVSSEGSEAFRRQFMVRTKKVVWEDPEAAEGQGEQSWYTFHLSLLRYPEYEEVAFDVNADLKFHSKNKKKRRRTALPSGDGEKGSEVKKEEEEQEEAAAEEEEGETVGYLEGYLLTRPSNLFYEAADAISNELQHLACMFCDHRGIATRINHPKLQEESPRCVKSGGFFNIDKVEVHPAHKGKDLGLRIIHECFVFLGDEWTLAVMIPAVLNSRGRKWEENNRMPLPSNEEEWTPEHHKLAKEAAKKVVLCFARMGFVQAGRNPETGDAWFLTADMYFPPSNDSVSMATDQKAQQAAIERWITRERAEREIDIYTYPPAHVPTGLDLELRELVSSHHSDIRQIEDIIGSGASIHGARAMHLAAAKNDSVDLIRDLVRLGGDINRPDEYENTPLHVAACALRPSVILYLVNLGADKEAKNMSGNTPLNALEAKVESLGDFSLTFGLKFPPEQSSAVPIYESFMALMPEEMKSLLMDGWLSPRMLKMLCITVEYVNDCLRDDEENFHGNEPVPLLECMDSLTCLEYIPPLELFPLNPTGLDKSFHKGWQYVWVAIESILCRNGAPTVERIRSQLLHGLVPNFDERQYGHFVQKGGRIEYALDALFRCAENAFFYDRGPWLHENHQVEIKSLPRTCLDGVFDVARYMCINRGGGFLSNCGPYHREWYHFVGASDDEDE